MNLDVKSRCKNSQHNIKKPNSATYKKDYTAWPNKVYPKNAKLVWEAKKSNNVIMPYQKDKRQNHISSQ